MNELGVDRSLMFPTLASLLEERMRDDPELTHAAIHALNEWMYEEWSFNYEDRIFATPVITLPIVDKAIEELEWVLERGAKTVLIRPAPVPGFRGSRSFGYPEFDPFWQAVVDADILVSMHSSDSGYTRYSQRLDRPEEMLPFRLDSFRYMTGGHRPIEDTMAAFVCHGVFARFPDLRVASIEAGGQWIPAFVEHLATSTRRCRTPSTATRSSSSSGTSTSARSTRTTSAPHRRSSAPTTCSSVPTSPTPRDWPSLAATSTTCRRAWPTRTCGTIMGGNLARIMHVEVPPGPPRSTAPCVTTRGLDRSEPAQVLRGRGRTVVSRRADEARSAEGAGDA